ncbi:hypothetical protein HJC23_011431 [Cyclotella cryptica]|uniref:Uncharacterized protein n=1 Tax=Cyclotella cryptica TaxID=29204 RepID=A0ABD3PLE4_9STRA|eukprot:CCRYP_013724-RA/>CCRYP_013724-RA protein AED:0.39 eAED:0.39 QI:0/-1/0/1/-1/1/1/0/99
MESNCKKSTLWIANTTPSSPAPNTATRLKLFNYDDDGRNRTAIGTMRSKLSAALTDPASVQTNPMARLESFDCFDVQSPTNPPRLEARAALAVRETRAK